LEQVMSAELSKLWNLNRVGDIRQVGLVAGVELVRDWRTKEPYDLGERVGMRVCEEMARRGVLTRPIGNVIVIMPPYCTLPEQVNRIVDELYNSVTQVLGTR
ncbi:MAG: aminotransferase class III-fold pyridoxal phosphate-dependent enzyme, partial [Verrucomicrobiae bacterium]|nr:aminotransferase class III-fold pyridoxal phosphate-dependent enzyme [Verrucomicrobiae bacterium]